MHDGTGNVQSAKHRKLLFRNGFQRFEFRGEQWIVQFLLFICHSTTGRTQAKRWALCDHFTGF